MNSNNQINLELGGFLAGFRPEAGGNLVRLHHLASGTEILRTPPDDETYNAKPEIWGIPVLMPPNRIRDGRFVYQDRVYQLPVNEPAPRHNNLHGIVLHRAWEFCQTSNNSVEMSLDYPGSSADEGWMHSFRVVLRYEFSLHSLFQEIKFINTSDLTMPLMAGYHTAFNFPDGAELKLSARSENRLLDDVRKIVNGQTAQLPSWQIWQRVPAGKNLLGQCAMDRDYGEARCSIRYAGNSWQMHYILPEPWREWVIWNGTGYENFVCVEPQSCRIDAMNINLPPAESGLIELPPGSEQTLRAFILMENTVSE